MSSNDAGSTDSSSTGLCPRKVSGNPFSGVQRDHTLLHTGTEVTTVMKIIIKN